MEWQPQKPNTKPIFILPKNTNIKPTFNKVVLKNLEDDLVKSWLVGQDSDKIPKNLRHKYQIPIWYWYFLSIPNSWLPIDITSKGVPLTTSVAPPYHFFRVHGGRVVRSWSRPPYYFCPRSPSPWGRGEGAGRPAGAQLPAWPTTFPPDFRVNDTRSHSNRVIVTWATMSAYIAAIFFKSWICRVFRYSNFKN